MSTLFVLEQGAKIGRTSHRIIIEKNREVLLEIPEFKIQKIFIFGNVQVSTQALRFFLSHSKDVSFFTLNGKLVGKLVGFESKNVFLRVAQYKAHSDEAFCFRFAADIVKAKIRNSRTVLQKFYRNHSNVDLAEEISRLEDLLLLLERKTTLNSIRGVEGIASRIYFLGFSKMIRNKSFVFDGRNRNPPKDPVNSLLSLGYAMLTSELFSVLWAMGLDPYLGFLHRQEYSRPSLALDLIEEFRPAIIDRFVLDLINKNMISPEDFYMEQMDGEEALKVLLSEEAKRVFFYNYERRMASSTVYRDESVKYRELLERRVRNLIKVIRGEEDNYPFQIR